MDHKDRSRTLLQGWKLSLEEAGEPCPLGDVRIGPVGLAWGSRVNRLPRFARSRIARSREELERNQTFDRFRLQEFDREQQALRVDRERESIPKAIERHGIRVFKLRDDLSGVNDFQLADPAHDRVLFDELFQLCQVQVECRERAGIEAAVREQVEERGAASSIPGGQFRRELDLAKGQLIFRLSPKPTRLRLDTAYQSASTTRPTPSSPPPRARATTRRETCLRSAGRRGSGET